MEWTVEVWVQTTENLRTMLFNELPNHSPLSFTLSFPNNIFIPLSIKRTTLSQNKTSNVLKIYTKIFKYCSDINA